jgi:hypothetical protein
MRGGGRRLRELLRYARSCSVPFFFVCCGNVWCADCFGRVQDIKQIQKHALRDSLAELTEFMDSLSMNNNNNRSGPIHTQDDDDDHIKEDKTKEAKEDDGDGDSQNAKGEREREEAHPKPRQSLTLGFDPTLVRLTTEEAFVCSLEGVYRKGLRRGLFKVVSFSFLPF